MSKTTIHKIVAVALVTAGIFFVFGKIGVERIAKHIFYRVQAILVLSLERDLDIKLDISFHRQEHSLSCEIATLKMALDYYGLDISENELLTNLVFDTTEPRSPQNIWGNPNLGFVGDIDGKIPDDGYGVYPKPLAQLTNRYRPARAFEEATLSQILTEVARKRPVIVWGSIGSGKDISWRAEDGEEIKAVLGEHTRVITGFSGTVSNPKKIFLMDPVYDIRVMTKANFLADWALLDNKAVVVY